ncbi:MAG: ferrous iron transport protein B [Ignavibacterium sp.]|nr:ferrous iron transport protein B [Ignavibacterium sp.]
MQDTALIYLIGPPNSGKTTLFNIFSGKHFKTVNYPGSTVEYSSSDFLDKFEIKAKLFDFPGLISLNPDSLDEEIVVESLFNNSKNDCPNLILVTADSSQITRHLLLTKQLIDAGFNVVLVLTMKDILFRKNFKINTEKLSELLGIDVVSINGRTEDGIDLLVSAIKKNLNKPKAFPNPDKLKEFKTKDSLIKTFENIEQIASKVIEPINIDIQKANNQLNILNPVLREYSQKPDELTLKIDKILLHKYFGFIFFLLMMGAVFTSIFWLAAPLMDLVDSLFSSLANYASNSLGNNWYSDLIADGIISGTGAVLIFLPQILILFLILGLLEDTGYLARGAMLIDKPLSKIGLNGKSFVPMLSGFACAIPAILSTRTISNRRERLLTIFIIPLMSCSARLPVYVLLIAFLTPQDKPWLAGFFLSFVYLVSIILSIIVAYVINKFNKNLIKSDDNSSFILELPTYKLPKLKNVLRNSYENSKEYILRAGPVILILSLIIWFLTYFPNYSPQIEKEGLSEDEVILLENSERLANSYAAKIGEIIEPIMLPLGFDWRIGVSLITAFAAREVFVSSLALIFKITEEENIQTSLLNAMREAKIESTGEKLFTTSTSIGLIFFFIFAMQCISTLAVSKKETGSWRIPILQLIIFTSTAYVSTFLVVNFLRALGIN